MKTSHNKLESVIHRTNVRNVLSAATAVTIEGIRLFNLEVNRNKKRNGHRNINR